MWFGLVGVDSRELMARFRLRVKWVEVSCTYRNTSNVIAADIAATATTTTTTTTTTIT